MIYLQTLYSRRDPISIGLQNAFQPVYDLSEEMACALRRLDANERRARMAVPVPVRRPHREIAAAC